jgi:hypothetical protein
MINLTEWEQTVWMQVMSDSTKRFWERSDNEHRQKFLEMVLSQPGIGQYNLSGQKKLVFPITGEWDD